MSASDGGYVAVGNSDEGAYSFIVKTKGDCSNEGTYNELTGGGSGCSGWDWVTKYGTADKSNKANWVTQSPDGSYFIVAGISSGSDGKSIMNVAKIQSSDGEIVWEMTNDSGSGSESVAFTSDGGFIIGGYLDCESEACDIYYINEGVREGAKPFIAKVSAEDAAGDSAPTSFEWTYTKSIEEESVGSAKAIRIDSDDNVYAVIGYSVLVKLDAAGEEVWITDQIVSA
jgi:hypothetical protein